VGEACNGREAVELCQQVTPDLVLMDLVMPVMSGIEATEITHSHFPSIQVIILTNTVEMDLITTAMQIGAYRYMIKNVSVDEMSKVIQSAVA
jgi:NarL family two-component system response regulator LiaR